MVQENRLLMSVKDKDTKNTLYEELDQLIEDDNEIKRQSNK